MGQVYKPVSIEKKEYVLPHDYDFNGSKLIEHSWIGNTFVSAVENLIKKGGKWYKDCIVWAGKYAKTELNTNKNLYKITQTKILSSPINEANENLKYVVNMDTKEFVDLNKVPYDKYDMRLHPLPILTCEGNGNGMGDLHPERTKGNVKLIGSWARNRVTMRKTRPKKNRGYEEIEFDLIEK